MHINLKNEFTGGMNLDDEAKSIPEQDWRYALNIRGGIAYAGKQNVVTNLRGNLEVPYTLPAGTNKTIGSYEDIQENTVIYFIYNSNGNHQILRYFPSDTAPYGAIELQIEYDFGWTADTQINGIDLVNGKLLYWNDPQPRKVNIEKARYVLRGTKKDKKWQIYFPKTTDTSISYVINITFRDENGNIIFVAPILLTDISTREIIITQIAAQLNAAPLSPVTAYACDCTLQFTEKIAGTIFEITSDETEMIIVADNWYGLDKIDRFFDRIKWMPTYVPQAEYRKDENYLPNYVKNKVFQFRLQYNYDDFEESALGIISQIPINNLGCDGTSGTEYNYINVNFDDPTLLEYTTLCLFRNVELLAREGNDGAWRSIIQLTPCDFLDYEDGQLVARFDFYNDINSTAVGDAEVAKQYDDVPLEAEAGILVKNRGILANVTKGYDAPDCIDAKAQVEFIEDPNPKLYKITGKIRIFNPFFEINGNLQSRITEPTATDSRSGIFYNTDEFGDSTPYPFFGGFENGYIIPAKPINEYRQLIPEGGFPVYLAGTNFFTVSKQKNVTLPQNADGSILANNTADYDGIVSFYNDGSDMYSEFELLAPEGEYIIRLASHWCSFDDVLGKGSMYNLSIGSSYQQTSTQVWGVVDSGGVYSPEYELRVTVSGADVFAGTFYIIDMVEIDPLGSITGYVIDANGDVDVQSVASGVRVHRAIAGYTTTTNQAYVGNNYTLTYTDHNGYFCLPAGNPFAYSGFANNTEFPIAIQSCNGVVNGVIGGSAFYIGSAFEKSALDMLFSGTISNTIPDGGGVLRTIELIIPTDTEIAREQCSTFLEGAVVDSVGSPVSDVSVVFQNGGNSISQSNGEYDILIWADMKQQMYDWLNLTTLYPLVTINIREGDLLFSSYFSCLPVYSGGQTINGISVTPFGANTTILAPPYSPTATKSVSDFVVDETDTDEKALKRGGTYPFGIRLYDEAGRFCSVVKAFDLYLPFITENIGSYTIEDFNGLIYPSPTYLYGKPSIKWVLDSATVFPDWAKSFQWLRLKNTTYGRYFQWIANEVTYISALATNETPEVTTSYSNRNATAIKISIKNILDYQSTNNNSQISYEYQVDDRVRLITNRELEYINGINDFEITGYDPATQEIVIDPQGFSSEIKSGSLFEIFNTQTLNTNEGQIYYEIGERIGVTNGIPDSFSGVFIDGDTYWRGRNIIVNDTTSTFSASYPAVIEDAAVSDFYPSTAQDIGRAGVIDEAFKQIHYPTMMQNSGIYIEGTAVNGLSSFSSVDNKQLSRPFGAIKSLNYVGNTLLSVHENKVVANYIELRSLSDSNETDGLLAISDAYFGNDRPMLSEYGSQHRESIVQYNGLVYAIDAAKGVIWRYDNNGLDVISDKKIRSYVKTLCAGDVTFAPAVFDPYYREYIVSVYTGDGDVTLAWNEDKNRWTTFYSFLPELYASVLRSIVSFKEGKLWIHDRNPIYNNFYGVQHQSELTFIPHSDNLKMSFMTLLIQGVQDDPLTNDWYASEITNDFNQSSRIKKPHFRLKENFWCASFLRDTTDTTVTDPIINGRNLRGQELTIKLVNDSTASAYIQQIITTAAPSERTPK